MGKWTLDLNADCSIKTSSATLTPTVTPKPTTTNVNSNTTKPATELLLNSATKLVASNTTSTVQTAPKTTE